VSYKDSPSDDDADDGAGSELSDEVDTRSSELTDEEDTGSPELSDEEDTSSPEPSHEEDGKIIVFLHELPDKIKGSENLHLYVGVVLKSTTTDGVLFHRIEDLVCSQSTSTMHCL
jgi:hypothetical protein